VAKAFEDIYREPPTWYVLGGSGQFSAFELLAQASAQCRMQLRQHVVESKLVGVGGWWVEWGEVVEVVEADSRWSALSRP